MTCRGIIARKAGAQIVVFGTSLIGSYAFTRGWSVLFGGYPTEAQLVAMFESGEPVDLGKSFWIYFAVFLVTLVISSFWQLREDQENEEVKAALNESSEKINDDFERVQGDENK